MPLSKIKTQSIMKDIDRTYSEKSGKLMTYPLNDDIGED
jgi:hypothetical protein